MSSAPEDDGDDILAADIACAARCGFRSTEEAMLAIVGYGDLGILPANICLKALAFLREEYDA